MATYNMMHPLKIWQLKINPLKRAQDLPPVQPQSPSALAAPRAPVGWVSAFALRGNLPLPPAQLPVPGLLLREFN